MSKPTPKNHKNRTTLLLFYVDTRKKIESNKRQWISFCPKGGAFPTENHHAFCGKHIPKSAPNETKILQRDDVDATP